MEVSRSVVVKGSAWRYSTLVSLYLLTTALCNYD